jgi:hypothetical protein
MGYEETFKLVIELIVCLSSVGFGFGLSCWIFGNIIDKSNNFGDNLRTNRDYRAFIHFTYRKDRLSYQERKSFCTMHAVKIDAPSSGPDGNDLVRRLSNEEIAKYEASTEEAVLRRENMLKGTGKKHGLWE